MVNSFLELSKILTGFENLKPEIAGLYYKQLHAVNGDALDKLLNTFDTTVKNQPGNPEDLVGKNIWLNPAYKALCQSIILAWYNSAIATDPNNPWIAPPEVYYEALLWKAVEAHPPALSGGYFGYWRYAPEN
jgi:hypothetical protein